MVVFGFDIETTGTNPFEHKVISIQYRKDGETKIYREWEVDEKIALLDFLNEWKKIPRSLRKGGENFVSFNSLKFDAPFLLVRALKNKIDEEEGWNRKYLWENLVHGPSVIDLYQLLGDSLMGFASWRNCLIGTFGDYTGKDIPIFYKKKEYKKIEMYIEDEMTSLEKIYNTLKDETFYEELMNLRNKSKGKWPY